MSVRAATAPDPLQRARRRAAWAFLAPALLVLAAVAGWPLVRTVRFAFTDATLSRLEAARWVGWENFAWLLADGTWWRAVGNTLVFAGVSVAAELVLGLAIALVLQRAFPGRGLLRAVVLIPWAIPTVVSGRMWAWMFHDVYGVVNDALLRLGLLAAPRAWLADPVTAMGAIIVTDVWKTTPFMAFLLLAGLQTIPPEVHEAARADGAGAWRTFWRVTLPLLRPALLVALVFRTLDALRAFDLIYVMTSNSPETATVSVYARQQLIDFQEVGYGSAAAVLIFFLIAAVTAVYLTLLKVEAR